MKKSHVVDLLHKCKETENLVSIVRNGIDNYPIDGIPLMISPKLLVLQYVYNFALDGYKIVRLKDISYVIVGESEKFHDFILTEEGILKQICLPSITSIESWTEVIRQLSDLGNNVIISCEKSESNTFNIGRILSFNKISVSMLCFDGAGQWDKVARKIKYKEITSVTFNNRYSNMMSKYTSE